MKNAWDYSESSNDDDESVGDSYINSGDPEVNSILRWFSDVTKLRIERTTQQLRRRLKVSAQA